MIGLIEEIAASTAALEEEVWKDRVHWAKGARMQRYRLACVAALCVERYPGDLVEIGVHVGLTTTRLADIAALNKRRVIAVDPWPLNAQGRTGTELQQFLHHINQHRECIDILHLSSQDDRARAAIATRDLCFAFVDGEHTYEACMCDFETVAHAPVIAVDDLLAHSTRGVRHAFEEAAASNQWYAVRHPRCREGYLVLA